MDSLQASQLGESQGSYIQRSDILCPHGKVHSRMAVTHQSVNWGTRQSSLLLPCAPRRSQVHKMGKSALPRHRLLRVYKQSTLIPLRTKHPLETRLAGGLWKRSFGVRKRERSIVRTVLHLKTISRRPFPTCRPFSFPLLFAGAGRGICN